MPSKPRRSSGVLTLSFAGVVLSAGSTLFYSAVFYTPMQDRSHTASQVLLTQASMLGAEPKDAEPVTTSPDAMAPDNADPFEMADAVELTAEEIAALIRHGRAEPLPRTPKAIRIATYNVENLFDDHDDPTLNGRWDDADNYKPEWERSALEKTIRSIDADVLCLEEVESEAALREFVADHLGGMGYDYIVSPDAGDERGIEQSVLSRYPIVHVEQWIRKSLGGIHPEKYGRGKNWHAGEPIVFHRSPLRVDVRVPPSVFGLADDAEAYELTVFALHSKSGRHSGYWREAEARGLAKILSSIQESEPDRNIVVMGDFNAQADSESLGIYLGAGLKDLFEGATGPAEGVTHSSGRRIDFILYNDAVMPEVVASSRFVLGTPVLPEGADWRTEAPPQGYSSDHYAVVVDLAQ